ncbi:hypothetical protein [Spirillospora sp. NPDC029432]|uniref:hypothetical protein n=1 Tax=Spirillospora sp. NPDC029432 TaxID=3154599 RepID=UPI0034554C90
MGDFWRWLGGVLLAAAVCVLLSMPLLLWPLGLGMAPDRQWMPKPPPLTLVYAVAIVCAIACLMGGATVLMYGPYWLGMGLISGWIVVGVGTGGWCMGMAPEYYAPAKRYAEYVDRFAPLSRQEAERRAMGRLREVAGAGARPYVRARQGGCWIYAGRAKGLVEPPGSGTVEVVTTLAAERGQETVDRLAGKLDERGEAVGRENEAFFADPDGFVVELLPGERDAGVLVTVRSPCLRILR